MDDKNTAQPAASSGKKPAFSALLNPVTRGPRDKRSDHGRHEHRARTNVQRNFGGQTKNPE